MSWLTQPTSMFDGVHKTTAVEQLTLGQVLTRNQDGTYQAPIEALRALRADKAKYKQEKERLRAFTPGCALHTRAAKVGWKDKLIAPTQIIHLDVDGVDAPALKTRVITHPAVVFAFISPSGEGLKLGIASAGITDTTTYSQIWRTTIEAWKALFPDAVFKEDEHVKFLHALCFVSHDPDLYVNDAAVPFLPPPSSSSAAPPPSSSSLPEKRGRKEGRSLQGGGRREGGEEPARVEDALTYIPAEEYDIWLRVGMALHASGEAWARALWDAWSQRSEKYDAAVQEEKWSSFTPDGGVNLATVFHLAREHGYLPPPPATFAVASGTPAQQPPADGPTPQEAADVLLALLPTLPDEDKQEAILDAMPALSGLDEINWIRLKRDLKAAVPHGSLPPLERVRKEQRRAARTAPAASGTTTAASGPIVASGTPAVPYSDYTNALALVRNHGAQLRYCHPWGKWLVWTDTHWDMEATGQVMRWGKDTILALLDHVKDLPTMEQQQALLAHVKASLSTAKLKAMVENAQSELPLPVLPEALDRDPWLLNAANGTLDLRTGTLRPHDRDDMLTRCIPVAYDPQATCPTWDAFLWRIMGGTNDSNDTKAQERATRLIAFLQRAVGYALTGVIREHVLLILWGSGRNGKSTFLNTLLALLGAYAMKAPSELLMAGNNDRHPTERADLFHKRFVAVIETEQGRRMAEVFVKEATGGDKIRARRMREDFWEFDPTHKLFLATNHKPVITGTDNAIWERMRLIPFTVTIPPEERDTTLPDKLQAELPGILAWAVRGCQMWQKDGLGEPVEVTTATADYRAEMDVLGQFIEDCCVKGDIRYRSKASELYDAYRRWCEQNGVPVLVQRTWGMALTERGFETSKVNGRSWWKGIALQQKDEEGKDDDHKEGEEC